MKAPKCRVCESEHWLTEPHVFKRPVTVSELLTQVVKPLANAQVANSNLANRVHAAVADVYAKNFASVADSSTYRHRDPEKRRAYQRELMRKRRAA